MRVLRRVRQRRSSSRRIIRVAARGVSAYPASVTGAMVANFLAGGAASSVAAAHLALALEIVDVEAPYDAAVAREGVRLVRDETRGAKVASVSVFALTGWRYRVRAGGVTGDFLGATQQVGECALLLALAIARGGAA